MINDDIRKEFEEEKGMVYNDSILNHEYDLYLEEYIKWLEENLVHERRMRENDLMSPE